jgi:hypothetical protein
MIFGSLLGLYLGVSQDSPGIRFLSLASNNKLVTLNVILVL